VTIMYMFIFLLLMCLLSSAGLSKRTHNLTEKYTAFFVPSKAEHGKATCSV
jgi:hypothetical protein